MPPGTTAAPSSGQPARPADRPAAPSRAIGLPLGIAFVGLATMGFNTIGIGFLPLSDFVFFALASLIGVLSLTGSDRMLTPAGARGSSPRILLASVVIVTMGVLASFRSFTPETSLQIIVRIGYLTLLWFWMLRCVAVDRRSIGVLVMGWRIAVLVSCAGAIAANAGLIHLGVAAGENRQTAWFGHPNDLAGFLALAVPVFVMAAPRDRTSSGRAPRVRWAFLLATVVFGIATTGSISALLAAVVGTAAAGLALSLTGRRVPGARRVHPITVMLAALAALAGIALLARSDAPVIERLTRFEQGNSGVNSSVEGRSELNEQVVQSLDDVLAVGHGMTTAGGEAGTAANVHNMYLKLVFEIGVIGAAALVFLLGVTLKQAWMLLRSTAGSQLHATVVAVFGSVVAGLTFAAFQPINTQRYFWLPIGLVQGIWTLRRRELSAHPLRRQISPA
jgi:O-antigen ligase